MKMRPVSLELKRNAEKYEIIIVHDELKDLTERLSALKIGTTAVVVTDPVVRKYHEGALASALRAQGFEIDVVEVPAGEASKSAQTAFDVIHHIALKHPAKEIFLIALGGGVIGDLTGFVAAVYKRGVPYVQVPTTLLAQIDSAIGGKTAVDLPFGKNLAGVFYQPRLVFSDTALLSTLDRRQIRAGLAEAVKYGVICDKNLFAFIEKNVSALLDRDQKALAEVVYQCSRIKASIVSRDEKETQGLRTILNFGHTIGHAVEAAGGYGQYNHGEAVALGMRAAARISLEEGLVSAGDVDRLNHLLSAVGLPERIEGLDAAAILDCMRHDKKFRDGKNRFVLMTGIGTVKVKDGIKIGTDSIYWHYLLSSADQ